MLCPSHIGDLAGSDAHSSSSASNIEDTGNASSTLTVDANADAPSPPATSPALIGFRYVWTVRVNERKLSAEESVRIFLLFTNLLIHWLSIQVIIYCIY